VPIEAKMVSRAIEKAQNTVEQRNAEIRKNVLKYDEVMNEQRKVVYARRKQILEGADLREQAMNEYLAEALDTTIRTYCVADYSEEWDLDGLLNELNGYWPVRASIDEMRDHTSTDGLYEDLVSEAVGYYEQREAEVGVEVMREVERQVMLRILDTKWREHLYEMDYLQEGINLRAMGQRDPLVEWQREGYQMFEQMMDAVAQDFIKYVMHVQVQVAPALSDDTGVSNVQYSAPEDPSSSGGAASMAATARAQVAAEGGEAPPAEPEVVENVPIVKSDWDKTPRNAPCPCGSGKKFKLCHGK
jgi:preprotein translocase subunit SecA